MILVLVTSIKALNNLFSFSLSLSLFLFYSNIYFFPIGVGSIIKVMKKTKIWLGFE